MIGEDMTGRTPWGNRGFLGSLRPVSCKADEGLGAYHGAEPHMPHIRLGRIGWDWQGFGPSAWRDLVVAEKTGHGYGWRTCLDSGLDR